MPFIWFYNRRVYLGTLYNNKDEKLFRLIAPSKYFIFFRLTKETFLAQKHCQAEAGPAEQKRLDATRRRL